MQTTHKGHFKSSVKKNGTFPLQKACPEDLHGRWKNFPDVRALLSTFRDGRAERVDAFLHCRGLVLVQRPHLPVQQLAVHQLPSCITTQHTHSAHLLRTSQFFYHQSINQKFSSGQSTKILQGPLLYSE